MVSGIAASADWFSALELLEEVWPVNAGILRNQALKDLDKAFLRVLDCQAIQQTAVENPSKRTFGIINSQQHITALVCRHY